MALEAVYGAGTTLQGSSSNTARKAQIKPKLQNASNVAASNEIAKRTTDIAKKESSSGGKGEENNFSQSMESQQAKKAVEELKRRLSADDKEVVYGIHEETKHKTLKIIDKNTKKVLREFPPEETLDMIAKVWENAGIVLDRKM
ncbi:flagellar protein FlaG [Lachnospiraceae bacterium C7]|nr:flagellar protein FlaG [Lachnospiraceae bacterium C7]